MTDVLYFEKDGFTYAKGFFNQNGWSFYVLREYMNEFEKKIPPFLQEEFPKGCYIEYVEDPNGLPGGTRCPPDLV